MSSVCVFEGVEEGNRIKALQFFSLHNQAHLTPCGLHTTCQHSVCSAPTAIGPSPRWER